MKLFTREFRLNQRRLGSGVGFTLTLLIPLALLEVVGRLVSSDLWDALAVLMLGLVGFLVALRHHLSPLPWVTALKNAGASLLRGVKWFTFDMGIDFRGSPPIRRAFPVSLVLYGAILLGLAGLGIALGLNFPRGLRPWVVPVCYLVWLAGLTALWALLIASILLAFLTPIGLIHEAWTGSDLDASGRRARAGTIALYFASLVVAAVLLPIWAHLALCGVAVLLNFVTLWMPADRSIQILWRPNSGGHTRSMSWGTFVTAEFLLAAMTAVSVVMLACAGRVFGSTEEWATVPVTMFLGSVLAWLAPGALLVFAGQVLLGRWRDPARPAKPVLHVVGEASPEQQGKVRRRLGSAWRVVFGPKPAPVEAVRVALVPAERSQATEFEPTWPLAISVDDLDDAMVLDRLVRRDEIQKRRKVLSALEGVFKRAAGRRYQAGLGYWIAPQFWFITGVTRETPDEESDPDDDSLFPGNVGAPYHRLMTRGARHHLYLILRALQVDLIFIEDGIKFSKLKRVLRVLFDLYDRHRGERRAEDVHFAGLNGTRVMIHDVTMEEPFRSESYPEPKYDKLGRARVLHIFKDRGEQEEPLETPFDFSSSPAPLALV